ncbi:hypothetical protein CYANOKiyG1_39860 [Okeania sp. KiyG1]|nr:hypothetical protein CYANOKiyG1_39860 [Okeania sp. KiyG1]
MGRWGDGGPTPNPSLEGNVGMGDPPLTPPWRGIWEDGGWGPTPNPSLEGRNIW